MAGFTAIRKVNKNWIIRNIDFPVEGLVVHLHGYGYIKLFKFEAVHDHTSASAGVSTKPADGVMVDLELRGKSSQSRTNG